MNRPRLQFSLRSMLCFLVATALLTAIHLKPSVRVERLWLSISLPPGESHEREWIAIDRGFPFRFQQTRLSVQPGTGQARLHADKSRLTSTPRVTHHFAFVVDLLCMLVMATTIAIAPSWITCQLGRSATVRPSRGNSATGAWNEIPTLG